MLASPKKKKSCGKVPVLRGHLHNQIKKNLAMTLIMVASAAISFRVLYVNRRRNRYAEFYSCYDPEAHFTRMQAKGVMESDPLC